MAFDVSLKVVKDDKKLKKLIAKLKKSNGKAVDVGFLGGEIHKDSGASMAEIATVHEFGSADGKIPERSFMRSTLKENKNYESLFIKLSKRAFSNEGGGELKLLAIVGETIRKDLIIKMGKGPFTALKEETIKRKKSSKPLIDTGALRNSITWKLFK